MSSPDRRPVLYAAVGAVILVLAFFLFRGDGPDDDLADTYVFRPQTEATALQASSDDAEATPVQDETEEQVETAEQPAEDPFPVEDATLDAAPVSTPVRSEPKPVAQKSEQIQVATKSPMPGLGGDYFLVVGSYGDPNNAQRLVRQLDGNGIAAEIHSTQGAGGPVHRVRVGYFADRSRAEAFGRKLQKDMKLDFWISSR